MEKQFLDLLRILVRNELANIKTKKVAIFMIDNFWTLHLMKMDDIAEKTNTSKIFVYRFIKKHLSMVVDNYSQIKYLSKYSKG